MEFLDELVACFVYLIVPMIPAMFIFGPIRTILAVFFTFLVVGWIFILRCALDPELFIGAGFTGGAAAISVVMYTIASVGLIGLIIIRPDPNISPALKRLSRYYPAGDPVEAMTTDGYVNPDALKRQTNDWFSSLPIVEKLRARSAKAKAEALKAKTNSLRAQEELAREAKSYNYQKARTEVAEKRTKR